VQKQVYYLIGIGCGSILLGYLQVAFWSMAAERQTHAIRRKFFRAILHKEIAYFDTHKAGELNTQLTDDINKIHDGIGDKLGTTAQFLSTFITGFAIGKFIFREESMIIFQIRIFLWMEIDIGHIVNVTVVICGSNALLQSKFSIS
jgi:ATP-binding cassette subfamily B (MDR/TAP) protein 1